MKFGICVLSGFSMLALASCGILDRSDDASTNAPGNSAPNFSITGIEFSDVQAADVSRLVNSIQLFKTFKFNSLDLSARVLAFAGDISRGKNPNFASCVRSKIDNAELEATVDSARYNLNLDFVALCDSPAEPDDLIGDVKNNLVATLQIGCAGGKTFDFKGKSVKDLNISICDGAQSATFSYSFTVDARSTFKTKKGTEYAVTSAKTVLVNEAVSAPNGLPCNLVVENEKMRRMSGCRLVTQSKSFNNDPKYEATSPKSTTEPHPIVFQAAVTVENAAIEALAPYYSAAATSFNFNGWEGKLTYPNSWAAPKWEATIPNTSSKAGGELGKSL